MLISDFPKVRELMTSIERLTDTLTALSNTKTLMNLSLTLQVPNTTRTQTMDFSVPFSIEETQRVLTSELEARWTELKAIIPSASNKA